MDIKWLKVPLALLIFLFPITPALSQNVYKWKDDKGVVHFTDDAETIPEKYSKQAERQDWWAEKTRDQIKVKQDEQRIEEVEATQQIDNQEREMRPGENSILYSRDYIDICEERERHVQLAQKLFPREEIGKAFDRYREKYMTEEERILIPARISTAHPCHNQGKYIIPGQQASRKI